MSTRTRVTLFGMTSGLLWSAAPIFFSARSSEIFYIYPIIGVVTGVWVSFTLYKPLSRFRRWGSLWLGLLALPLGAFYFGFCFGVYNLLAAHDEISGFSLSQKLLEMFYSGLLFTYMTLITSLASYLGLVLVPSALITTYLLRLTMLHGGGGQNKSPATT